MDVNKIRDQVRLSAAVPLTPLREKSGTPVAPTTQDIYGLRVIAMDPVPLFWQIWYGGLWRRRRLAWRASAQAGGKGFFKELSGPRLAPSRDVCV
jgi:hypothetical protein